MSSIFSKIISGEIPSYPIIKDRDFFAFMDINPVAKGHVLIVPRKEIDYIFDMEDALLQDMIMFSKRVAKAMKKVIACKKIGMVVMGLEVPHAHIHLIPINSEVDMNFSNPRKEFTVQEFESIAAAITDAFD